MPCAITITKTRFLSAQAQAPKAAVEFDQAINYVNKIKVMLGPVSSFENPALPCVSWKRNLEESWGPLLKDVALTRHYYFVDAAVWHISDRSMRLSHTMFDAADPLRHRRARVQGLLGDTQFVQEGPEDDWKRLRRGKSALKSVWIEILTGYDAA